MEKTMNIKQAEAIVGGLSKTSKMPTMSISLPATSCKVGAKLRKIEGSVCNRCYACKGSYTWKPTRDAMKRRQGALDNSGWVNAMIYLINNKRKIVNSGLFRWHDSGDLQSREHLERILKVVQATPQVKHWIPTKEKGLIKKYLTQGKLPDNLVVRVSGAMVDDDAPKEFSNTSTVTSNKHEATCRSFENEGKCGDCRKCWDKGVQNIVYLSH